MIKKLNDKIKKHLKEVIALKTSPESIAIGFAIGTFFSLFPTFGLELIIIPVIILIFKRVSKVALLAAYVVWNPLITIPLFFLEYRLGDYILGDIPLTTYRFEILNTVFVHSRRFIVGSFIVSVILSFISYFVMLKIVKKYRLNEVLKNAIKQ